MHPTGMHSCSMCNGNVSVIYSQTDHAYSFSLMCILETKVPSQPTLANGSTITVRFLQTFAIGANYYCLQSSYRNVMFSLVSVIFSWGQVS